MSYAIVGAGNVGKALAAAFSRKGINVVIASRRSAEELAPVAKAIGPNVAAVSLQDAAKADVVILATPFKTYSEVARITDAWQGRTLIDATNGYGVSPEELGNLPSSAAIAQSFQGARVVKAFNHLPAEILAQDPNVNGGKRVIFLSSDDNDAAGQVATLVEKLGFAPVQLGKLAEGGMAVQPQGRSWGPLDSRIS